MNIPMRKVVEKKSYLNYLRLDKMPTIWCPGCGIGQAFKAVCMALDELGIPNDKTAMISGIGCSSRTPGYYDGFTLHTTHGRGLTVATGLKLYKPELTTIVFSGDGDGLAIGGNHFIHAARRNINLTLIIINNWIYGMTGGQVSPTTPEGSYATTMPYGNYDPDFDVAKLAIGAGATYVARGTSYHTIELKKLIMDGIKHKGFSVIEVLSPCTITYGRKNGLSIEEMYSWLKDNTLPLKAWEKLSEEQREAKIPRGLLHHDDSRAEYTEVYWSRAKALAGGKK